ncbi:MAG: cupin domain-containing protein [Planctomycetota bacterium]|jgi:quercetin dioxygenase-like cupin family protein
MLIKKIKDVPAEKVKMQGAEDVSVRVLFGPKDVAPTFAMRVFEFAQEGHTPYHSHPFEHEVLILKGEVAVVTEKGPVNLNVGHTLMVGPNEMHQFKNLSKTNTAEILCLVPVQYQK